jgi:hypothetical protein
MRSSWRACSSWRRNWRRCQRERRLLQPLRLQKVGMRMALPVGTLPQETRREMMLVPGMGLDLFCRKVGMLRLGL